MITKHYVLNVQSELKTISSQLLKETGRFDIDSFGWEIEHTDDNYIDWDIVAGNSFMYRTEETEAGNIVSYFRSIICVTNVEEGVNGLYKVMVKVDLPEEYGLPVKFFECNYEFDKSNPLDTTKGYPDALYEAYIYFAGNTKFSVSEKLSYLAGAMWEFASSYDQFASMDSGEVLGLFSKADVID
ncbi:MULTISPECIES: hypothetical protein [Vibrio]|uniref:hypothetical protein n=1 Tax=Vibrio TaxID=662 RepID=UPI001EECC9F3|nr:MULTISPECIES: hypothetical protein [Vibrio]MCG6387213.1 hypothetical protein [Vibrio fluvialis]